MALAVDAVFEKHGHGVRIHEAPPPEKADVADVAQRVHDRALRWLRKHKYIDERAAEDRSNEPAVPTPLDALAALALAGGTFLGKPFVPKERTFDNLDRKEPRFGASVNGFDVHCAVRIPADDDEGRERLIRYCARPPFALDRIEELKDGRIAYLMKTARRGSTHRVMTPMEFMGRLAILVPPPYYPLVRYHGVFAARSKWRALVTPKPPAGAARRKKKPKPCDDATTTNALTAEPSAASPACTTPHANCEPKPETNAPLELPDFLASITKAPAAATIAHPVVLADGDPMTLAPKHWSRILDGELFANSSRVDWAVLLQRTFGFNALRCPRCAAKMRVLATIVEADVIKKILSCLGKPTEPLTRARARDPTGQQSFEFDAA